MDARHGAARGPPRGVATAGDQCNAAARRTALAARTSRSECARRRGSRCDLGAGANYKPSYAPGAMAAHCRWRLLRAHAAGGFRASATISKFQEFALAQAAHFYSAARESTPRKVNQGRACVCAKRLRKRIVPEKSKSNRFCGRQLQSCRKMFDVHVNFHCG